MTQLEPYRVLLTISRSWQSEEDVQYAIRDVLWEAPEGRPVVFVHGDCWEGFGSDGIADRYLVHIGAAVERHPVDKAAPCTDRCRHGARRNDRCPAAPQYRNEHMVSLGADRCLAFIGPCERPGCRKPKPHGSHGTTRTAVLAENAGIPVHRYEQTGDSRDAARRP